MKRFLPSVVAVALTLFATQIAFAGQVLVFSFQPSIGNSGPDVQLDGAGNLTSTGSALNGTVASSLTAVGASQPNNPVTLTLTGFSTVGSATLVGTDEVQNLSTGSFQIKDNASNVILAAGSVSSAKISSNSITGSVLSGFFAYTGGSLVVNYFGPAQLGNPGTFSLSLVGGPFTVSGGQFLPFTASASGLFTAADTGGGSGAPLPSTAGLGLVLLGGLGFGRVRRMKLA